VHGVNVVLTQDGDGVHRWRGEHAVEVGGCLRSPTFRLEVQDLVLQGLDLDPELLAAGWSVTLWPLTELRDNSRVTLLLIPNQPPQHLNHYILLHNLRLQLINQPRSLMIRIRPLCRSQVLLQHLDTLHQPAHFSLVHFVQILQLLFRRHVPALQSCD
jgi:hypothetical protein